MDSGNSFSRGQRNELQRAIDVGREICGLGFGVFVGPLDQGWDPAVARHSQLADAASAVLLAVDPGQRTIEIVTGTRAAGALDTRSCELAILAMRSSFEAGDLVGGIRDAVNLLAQRARSPFTMHLDEPA